MKGLGVVKGLGIGWADEPVAPFASRRIGQALV